MKQYAYLAVLLLLFCTKQAQAQGVPQYIMMNPNAVPVVGDTTFAQMGLFSDACPMQSNQYAYEAGWFYPALPMQGTITAVYFRLPGNMHNLNSPFWQLDTVLANSPILGTKIKMAITNRDTLYSPISCRKVNGVTVFDKQVFHVPAALQGKDSTKLLV